MKVRSITSFIRQHARLQECSHGAGGLQICSDLQAGENVLFQPPEWPRTVGVRHGGRAALKFRSCAARARAWDAVRGHDVAALSWTRSRIASAAARATVSAFLLGRALVTASLVKTSVSTRPYFLATCSGRSRSDRPAGGRPLGRALPQVAGLGRQHLPGHVSFQSVPCPVDHDGRSTRTWRSGRASGRPSH